MNKKLLGLAVAATLSISAFSASAEDMYRGAWYAVPGVSYMNTDSDFEADNGAGAFISIGKEISQNWDLQGRLGYNKTDEDLGLNLGESGDYKSTQLGLDALYMFSRDKFRPFLLAGLGWTRNDADYKVPGSNVDGEKSSWLASVGLGAQYLFSDRFGLQADLRHQWSRAELEVSGTNVDESGTVGNTLLNIGGIFRFGAAAPVVAAAAPVAAAPAPAPVAKCMSEKETITIGAAKLFGYDKSNIADSGKVALDEAAAKINANTDITLVVVTGHTDRTGSFSYNQKLSERRAKQVGDYLVAQGVDSSLIATTGRGEAVAITECKGNKVTKALISCLAPNRRVEILAEVNKQVGCN